VVCRSDLHIRQHPLTRAEATAAAALTFLASAVLSSYLVFRAGFTVSPAATLAAAVVSALAMSLALGRCAGGGARDVVAFLAVVVSAFAWLLRIAWPERLPLGGGPDITHHLVLVDYIERHWQLSRGLVSDPYLGEMIHYTPGSHLLIALAGKWLQSDGLHVLYPLLALSVALKIGFVFLIATRVAGPERAGLHRYNGDDRSDVGRGFSPGIIAVLLLFLVPTYSLGSFITYSFVAQVIAEPFAVAALWALVAWDDRPSTAAMVIFAVAAAATFITWPVWIGPVLLTCVVAVLLRHEVPLRARVRQLALGILPAAAVIAVHVVGRWRWLAYAGTGGDAPVPSIANVGWLAAVAAIALMLAGPDRRRLRTAVVFLAALGVQAIVLALVAMSRGVETPYLALKMMYLAVYPLAIVAARLVPKRAWSWALVAAGLVALVVYRPHATRIIRESTNDAGVWARDHVPPACVDYLVADGNTGVWLHLAVLRNARDSERMRDPDTFESRKTLERWIYPSGLPYAIAEDFDGLPRDIRTSVDVLARFDRSAVIMRRGPPRCDTGGR
jgi:hypothetical protein